MTTVVCLKLTSGEELIAKLADDQSISPDGTEVLTVSKMFPEDKKASNLVRISEPLVVGMQPVGKNQIGVGFMPWAIGNTGTNVVFSIRMEALVCVPYIASLDLERGYLQQVSGIDLSGSGIGSIN